MDNHFRIEGPASIGFSGGRTSGVMLFDYLKAYDGKLPQDVHVNFENTGLECEATLQFIDEVSRRWNIPITWLEYDDYFDIEKYYAKNGKLMERRRKRNLTDPADRGYKVVDFKTASRRGEPFKKMLNYYAEFRKVVKGMPPVLPNATQRICTAYLKIKVNSYHMQSIGYDDFNAAVGIRKDEPKRWAKLTAQNEQDKEHYTYVFPLWWAGITKQTVNNFWAMQPFDLQLDTNSDEGNCRYCFLKAEHKLLWIMRKEIEANEGELTPEIKWWIAQEEWAGQQFRSNRKPYSQLVQLALSGVPIVVKDEPIIDCICGE